MNGYVTLTEILGELFIDLLANAAKKFNFHLEGHAIQQDDRRFSLKVIEIWNRKMAYDEFIIITETAVRDLQELGRLRLTIDLGHPRFEATEVTFHSFIVHQWYL